MRCHRGRERHSAVYHRFGNTPPGEAFELVEDRSPAALREEFERDLPGAFTWEDLVCGPAVWRVRIGRA